MRQLKNIIIENKKKIMLPLDAIVGRSYNADYINHINIDTVEEDDIIYDIGMKTVNKYKLVLSKSATVFVNGTAGKYEDPKYATGTRELLGAIASSPSIKVAGGGDGVSAVKNFGLADRFTFLSTGGGATLEYIINGGLPAIDNIQDAKEA